MFFQAAKIRTIATADITTSASNRRRAFGSPGRGSKVMQVWSKRATAYTAMIVARMESCISVASLSRIRWREGRRTDGREADFSFGESTVSAALFVLRFAFLLVVLRLEHRLKC